MTEPRPARPNPTAAPRGVPLGRYAGAPVTAHWSVLVILALLTQILAISVLPGVLPGRHPVGYWLTGAAAALVFLAALLAHEFAHAVAARHYRIPIKRISLWMLGGQTELGDEPPTPRADAAIAAAGPATSLAAGGLFAAAAWLLPGAGLPGAALVWLSGVNVLLGVFNLLPGAPLDGGRLLRAMLWLRYQDRLRAAQASARAGRMLGTVLIALGAVQVLLAGSVFGLWLALIGWFVLAGAAGEHQAAAAQRLKGRITRDAMTTPPATAPSWWTVEHFAAHLGAGYAGRRVFPLVDFDGRPQNTLTVQDLLRVPPARRDSTRLHDAARSRAPTPVITPDTPLAEAMLPVRLGRGVAVVVEDGRVVGTLHDSDLDAAALAGTTALPGATASAAAGLEPAGRQRGRR